MNAPLIITEMNKPGRIMISSSALLTTGSAPVYMRLFVEMAVGGKRSGGCRHWLSGTSAGTCSRGAAAGGGQVE